ncbi:MAG TPA: AAA family ATPase [Syntrophales bacterium]|nr:AAA family ATPase [Syntrophales bacterium]
MHLKSVIIDQTTYPTERHYPFNLPVFQETISLSLNEAVTFFVGENGSGKSTLLQAIARSCGIHIWQETGRTRYQRNPYENRFCDSLTVEWSNGRVPGSFFGSDIFNHFREILDEWASSDPGQLEYFGGKSLVTQSHGESLMSFFRSRYKIKGLYLLDEPETALSPRSQLALLELLTQTNKSRRAQFIIATHSPILLACPDALIYSFDHIPIKQIWYEETEHYRIYRDFLENRAGYLKRPG